MESKPQSRLMPTLKVLWLITTAPLLLGSCGTVTIHDEQFCSPIPSYVDPATGQAVKLGATCDNFLKSNQLILSEPEYQAWLADITKDGHTVQVVSSRAVADYKAEIEKLCSKTPCAYDVKQTLAGLIKMLENGNRAQAIAAQLR